MTTTETETVTGSARTCPGHGSPCGEPIGEGSARCGACTELVVQERNGLLGLLGDNLTEALRQVREGLELVARMEDTGLARGGMAEELRQELGKVIARLENTQRTREEFLRYGDETCPGYGPTAGKCDAVLAPEVALCDTCHGHLLEDRTITDEHKNLTWEIEQALHGVVDAQGTAERLDRRSHNVKGPEDGLDLRQELGAAVRHLQNARRVHDEHLTGCRSAAPAVTTTRKENGS
ncbi:hypothetical protein [Thermomonospora cellulosilytica]|uniref:ATP-dependent exoDNAse (Exonuclease V) alpha subunit n=1 Tax=Thermomonospora cellulosilytica TaxID=1411118 RepID=A0A7W3N1P5_9ACTN|nr:hypothetical protein [Thermomonospora cellulosilytica]MBA9005862.1 ATP-dependent exoDNAse (exonuclease V) alpha subunit [Thermomonospora cellulosilytica]